jgi:hypothetical protein
MPDSPVPTVALPTVTLRSMVLHGLAAVGFIVVVGLILRVALPTRLSPFVSVGLIAVPFAALVVVVRRLKLREKSIRPSVFATSLVIAASLAYGLSMPGALRHASAVMIPFTAMVTTLGVQLAAYGYKKRRVGESLHCPRCDYEVGVPEHDAPAICPECAHDWKGRWIRGAVQQSGLIGGLGIAIVVIGLLPLAVQLKAVGKYPTSLLPTSGLKIMAGEDAWGHNKLTWTELLKRKLSQAESDALATKLLALRNSEGYLYGTPSTWMETAAATGTISPELVRRYYEEWFRPSVATADALKAGEPVQVRLAGQELRGGGTLWMYLWIHDVYVDGVPLKASQFTSFRKWGYIGQVNAELDRGGARAPSSRSPEYAETEPLSPGAHEIEIVFYRAAAPKGPAPANMATADGTPIAPPKSVNFERISVRKTITVAP